MATNTRPSPPNAPKPVELLSKLLDKGYSNATAQVIRSIARDTETGPLALRLDQFDQRAAELAAQGEQMSVDDPVLRALLADFGQALKKDALLINAAAPDLESLGIDAAGNFVRQTSLPGLSDKMLQGIGVTWNSPPPEAIQQVVQYTAGDAWKNFLSEYGDIEAKVRAIAVRGIMSGMGPRAIANEIRHAVETIPAFQANALMRTLQVTSFRDSQVVHELANADILQPVKIRMAALDDRTCMSCVALSGTELALGERVNDHWNGRCFSITILRGRKAPDVQTGEEWFENRTEAQQRAQMGDAAYEAWIEGAIALNDFPHHETDPLFGEVITEASLKGMIGEDAKKYYKNSR